MLVGRLGLLRAATPRAFAPIARAAPVAARRTMHGLATPRLLQVRATMAMLSLSSLSTSSALGAEGGLHALSGKRIDAETVTMADFVGKPVLVVNVASR